MGDDHPITYAELRLRVAARVEELDLGAPAVVVLTGATGESFVTTYLALLAGGHVPLLAGDHADRLAATWRAAAVITASVDDLHIERRPSERPPLHPDLALLLSTSGSTGAPKLVRLSSTNLTSNAEAIGTYLELTPDDRAITTLPLHYCYGLSVLHSHLAAGASIVLSPASVVDRCFADAVREHAVTNVAGVPHTFELLERAGPERVGVPSLRFLTQAGGRLAPDAVARWRDRAESWGAELYVMYGQTEATARMAYLPPALARARPDAIGVPIPGGALEVRPLAGRRDDVGELVYTGPNVMLGYATSVADLALGATLSELRTGDLGRHDAEHGVFEVVGRCSRFVKPFGLRIELDALETALADAGVAAAATGDDELLVVGAPGDDPDAVARLVRELTGLPGRVIAVVTGDLPRTSTGKVDYAALRVAGAAAEACAEEGPGSASPGDPQRSVATVFAAVLGRPVALDTTFVAAGGDSLNYVECSVRLERLLGNVPEDWHLRTVGELDALGPTSRLPRVDTTVVLRAVGICAVVATHMKVLYFPGGSHLLLAVVGYNLSRFQLAVDRTADRVQAALRTIARVALPAMVWTAFAMAVSDSYGVATLGLVNNYLGPSSHAGGAWHFWFIEAFVQLGLVTMVLLAVPPVRRLDDRHPYAFPLVLLVGALQLRAVDWFGIDDPANLRFRTHGIAWFFVLGWLAHRSTSSWQKALTTVVCVVSVSDFFHRPQREWFIVAGLVTLLWFRRVPWPRSLVPAVATLATASLWIFISHFQLWRPLDRMVGRGLAYPLTLLAGVALWAVAEHATRAASRRWHARQTHASTRPDHRQPGDSADFDPASPLDRTA